MPVPQANSRAGGAVRGPRTDVPARPQAPSPGQDPRAWTPACLGIDRPLDHTPLEPLDRVDHRLDQLLAEQGRFEAEVEQLGVDRVVVVLLLLDPGVVAMLALDRLAEVLAGL